METATLISFKLEYKGRSRAEITKFFREFYGYQSYSHYGRYRSKKSGYLDNIRNIRYEKGIIVIRNEDKKKIISYLRGKGAKVIVWKIVPNTKEKMLLGL